MPIGTETRLTGAEYYFGIDDESWHDPEAGAIIFSCTLTDDGGTRTEAEMDAIAQQVLDALAAGGFDTVAGGRITKAAAPMTPTP